MRKKILTLMAAAMAGMSASAQVYNVYKSDGTFVASYDGTHSVKMAKEAPATGPEYVTIGSLKWATMNLGATSIADDASTSYGDYYAWGATTKWYESVSWSGTPPTFTWKTDYSDGYTSSHQPEVSGSTLSATEDIATITYGSSWRMPTSTDFEYLYEACGGSSGGESWVGDNITETQSSVAKGAYWVEPSGTISVTCGTQTISISVNGALFCDGSSMVFFPAAGNMDGTSLYGAGTLGTYWSSSLYGSYVDSAYSLNFGSGIVFPQFNYGRYFGFTVRPVSD